MNKKLKIAVLGDYDENIIAHQCIPKAIHFSALALKIEAESIWIETSELAPSIEKKLGQFDGIWCAPGSPYKNRNTVLDAIRIARASGMAYLGTCGGYQHAILEFARNALGQNKAELEEENPKTSMPLISSLSCRLNSARKEIFLSENSQLCRYLKANRIEEEYQCGFGMNPIYQPLFENSSLKFVAFNDEKVPQAFELSDHPFFIGTAFQPERAARESRSHPLVEAFLLNSFKTEQ